MKRKRTARQKVSHIRPQQESNLTQTQTSGYRIAILTFFAIFLILILAGLTFMIKDFGNEYQAVELASLKNAEPTVFLFPTANDTLTKGETYTLRWEGGPQTIEMLTLVNKSLQKEGVSVAIADRAYNIENTGSYQLTIPDNIPDGLYRIEAGPLISDYFEIKSN